MKQYRTLNDGEIVMAGDEFWGIDRSWIPATEIGKKVTSYTHRMYRRPMTETSSQTTDTCPDCSDSPCDCGIPAGYQPDIRFAANFAPHIKVMEASKVAEIIQQRDDLLRYNEAFRQEALICSNCDAISKKEYDQAIEQLTAAQEEIERLQCAGIHSCHDNCERPNCVLRREIKEITEQRDGLRSGIDYASDQLAAVTEQRDRLAEALNRIANNNVQDLPETDYAYELGRMEGIAKVALQSLTTNAEVHTPLPASANSETGVKP